MIPDGFRFAAPLWLAALLLLPVVIWARRRAPLSLRLVPYAAAWQRVTALAAPRWPFGLACAGIVLLTVALARPQLTQDHREIKHAGYDIMLCIDLSSSMLSEDYERDGHAINRLDAVRPVIQAFIEQRPDDRVGVVLFSAKAYTLAPPTLDHAWLREQLERVHIGLIEDGTAIGDGLGVALTRLEESQSDPTSRRKGAFIVLLTDGANNCGTLPPSQAAAIARARDIPIYTVGAGRNGIVRVPVYYQGRRISDTHQESEVDEAALQEIASATGGRFFRADASDTITSAFHSIDQAQKIEFATRRYVTVTELFPWPAGAGSVLVTGAACLIAL